MSVNASNDNLGWIAPNFKLPDISGKTLSFENIKANIFPFECIHTLMQTKQRLAQAGTLLEFLQIIHQ